MTHSHPAPSSIRDDSICEPSLNPNKSSGDIVERTWTPEQFWEFATAFLGDHEASTSRDMIESRGLVLVSAAEIERLRRELDAANSNHRSMAHLLAETGIRLEHAESAVAAAYENAAKIADEATEQYMATAGFVKVNGRYQARSIGTPEDAQTMATAAAKSNASHAVAAAIRSRASAIRAAVSKKTAESGHSPSTRGRD